MRAAAVLTLTFLLSLPASSIGAKRVAYDPDRKPFSVPVITGRIRIDGIVDRSEWDGALALGLAYEQAPGENTEPPVQTTVLVANDESYVYAAFICEDPDPSSIRAQYADRDRIWSDDWVLLVLDTFNSEREAYNFACNPLGIQGDTYESPHGESDAWDAIWDSAGRITSEGYEVEMAVPFSSLRFQRTEERQVWGFDIARRYPRNVTHRFGFFPVDRDNECYACQYPKIVGFEGASPGRNVELDPTVTAIATQERPDWVEGAFGDPADEYEAGITARWGVTPNMTLTGTANPDFSQVEADARQLDVNTKFAIFYEEKRPFFLEGADIFNDRLSAVSTRTIGDPEWGVKLTGREGAHTVGAFVARDEVTNLLIPGQEESELTSLDTKTTAAALRYRFDLGRSSGIGLIATGREGDDYYNGAAGLDGFLRFLKSERLDFQLLGTWTRYPDETARAYAQPKGRFADVGFDATYQHRSENVHWYVHHRSIGKDFRSDLGFRPQVGEKHVCGGLARNWRREAGSWFTVLEVGTTHSHNWFSNGDLLSYATGVFLDYAGPLQTSVYISPDLGTEVYQGTEYDLASLYAAAEIQPNGLLTLAMELIAGDGIDYDNNRKGKGFEIEPSARLRAGRHLDVIVSHDYSFMDVHEERLYTTNISYLKAVYQFSSRMFVRGIIQYVDYDFTPALYIEPKNSEEQWLGSQLLFAYKINPRTIFYLGYSDGYYGDQGVDLTQTDRTVFAKIGYAWVL
jgi:hypothetical protein